MTPKEIIFELSHRGAALSRNGDKLVLTSADGSIDSALRKQIKANKYGLLDLLDRYSNVSDTTVIHTAEEMEWYPASSQQRRLYALQQLDLEGTVYNSSAVYYLGNGFGIEEIRNAFRIVVERHEALRTRFEVIDDELCQIVEEGVSLELEVEEIGEGEIKSKMLGFVRAFDLAVAPLLRVKILCKRNGDCILLTDMHHIISDGTSSEILIRDFARAYSRESMTPLRLQYKDFSVWQQGGVGRELLDKQLRYWLGQFSSEIPILEMPTNFPRPKVFDFKGASYGFTLDSSVASALLEYCRERGVTMYMLLLACFGVVLSRWCGQEDIVVGNAVSGRDHQGLDEVLGMFVNTLPMRLRPQGAKLFEDYLEEVKLMCLEGLENQQYPLEELIEGLNLGRDTSRNPLFDVMLVVQSFELSAGVESLGQIRPHFMENDNSKCDMSLLVDDSKSDIRFQLEYATSLYTEDTVARLSGHFIRVVELVVSNPQVRLSEIDILDASESEQLLNGFNATDVAYPRDRRIHELFEESVLANPDTVAVVFGGSELTYRELDERSNALARKLCQAHGVSSDVFVGLCLERSLEMIVGILGILKAGGAYLPIDPMYPIERIRFMLSDARVETVLTVDGSFPPGVDYGGSILDLLDDDSYLECCDVSIAGGGGSDLAYCIYTSGSTGEPKGVLIEHASASNMIFSLCSFFQFNSSQRHVLLASICFDASVQQIFGPLSVGATLNVVPRDLQLDVKAFLRYIRERKVNVIDSVPSYLNSLAELSIKEGGVVDALDTIISGGEILKVSVLDRLNEAFPGRRIFNAYGPTEGTINALGYLVNVEDDVHAVPIGVPFDNYKIYVLGELDRLVPVGVPGELCISGVGLARGYLNNRELTDEKFVANPYELGERMYRTGDLVRWLPDGNVEFLGRVDDQVKIRGYRVELGEIESTLSKLDGVCESVVVSKEVGEEAALVAYCVCEGVLDATLLRDGLSRTLPAYMLPSYFVELDSVPLNSNGKIDREALPAPEADGRSTSEYVAPVDDIERKLAEVLQDVLGIERVGTRDDFFELGGDSIKAIQVVSRMSGAGYALKVSDLFEHSTVGRLRSLVGESTREIDQGPASGSVSLSPIMRWFFESDIEDNHHWNQAVMLHSAEGFEEAALRSALESLVRHHDALRLVVDEDGGSLSYRSEASSALRLEVFDLRGSPNAEERIRESATTLQSSFDLYEGPLSRAGLFRTDDGDHLLLAIHHLLVDGVSWRILFEDLGSAYEACRAGREVALPLKTHSFQKWMEVQEAYAGSKALLDELGFWRGFLPEETLALPEGRSKVSGLLSDRAQVELFLDKSLSEELLGPASRAYGTEVNDLLLSALELALGEWLEAGSVLVNLEGHGREEAVGDADVTRTVGWFTSQYPFVLETEPCDIGLRIRRVKERLRQVPNKGVGYGVLRYLSDLDGAGQEALAVEPEISFNYLGSFDGDVSRGGGALSKRSSGTNVSTRGRIGYGLSIDGMFADGCLSFTIGYDGSRYGVEEVESLASGFESALKTVAECCRTGLAADMTTSTQSDLRRSNESDAVQLDMLSCLEVDLENRYEPFPMTDIQHAYWLGRDSAFEMGGVSTHFYSEFEMETFDLDRYALVWKRLVERHEMLRSVVTPDGTQRIIKDVPDLDIPVEDLSGHSEAEEFEVLLGVRKEMSHKVFDVHKWPLFEMRVFKLKEGRARISFGSDILIGDGASFLNLTKEFRFLYENPDAELDPLDLSFRDYVIAKRSFEGTAWFDKALRYWLDRLEELPSTPALPLARDPASLGKPRFGRRSAIMGASMWSKLKRISRGARLSPTCTVLSIFAEVIRRWSKTSEFTLNLTLFNRLPLHDQVNEVFGDFSSLSLLEVKSQPDLDFEERARSLQARLWRDLDNNAVGGIRVMRELARLRGERQVSFPVVFTSTIGVSETTKVDEASNVPEDRRDRMLVNSPDESLSDNYAISQSSQVWLDCQVFEEDDGLGVSWDFVEELFPDRLIDDMFAAFIALLDKLKEEGSFKNLSSEVGFPQYQRERRRLVNDTAGEVSGMLLHELFSDQAIAFADRPAIVTDARVLSYSELHRIAQGVADRLSIGGAGPGMLVAVVMEKGWEQIAACLGILRAGCAYVPLSSTWPESRLRGILDEAEVQVVCVQSKLDGVQESLSDRKLIRVDEIAPVPSSEVEVWRGPQSDTDLAYVIYTSGSTGRPKGVMIDHRGAVNTVLDVNDRLSVDENDVMFALSALGFDLSVYDIFGALSAGATIAIPEEHWLLEPSRWRSFMASSGVTVWNSVPALMQMLVDYCSDLGESLPDALRHVMLSGDWIPLSLPDRIRGLESDLAIHSLGGATEASIWSIHYPIGEVLESWKSIPYGFPLRNQSFHVLNDNHEDCPDWVPGELYIGGIGLAVGYCNDSEKTAGSFITHPRTKMRLYRTGDWGRYFPDGSIEFLGREDRQLKIRGHRIELGEIEAAFSSIDEIGEAVAMVFDEGQLAVFAVRNFTGEQISGRESWEVGNWFEKAEFKLSRHGDWKYRDQDKFIALPGRNTSEVPFSCSNSAPLPDAELVELLDGKSLSLSEFSELLLSLSQFSVEGSPLPKYLYPSAGSLNPVQLCVRVPNSSVEGIAPGDYLYDGKSHRLVFLCDVDEDESCNVELFLIGNLDAIKPIYGSMSEAFCLIESGHMAHLLSQRSLSVGLRTLPIDIKSNLSIDKLNLSNEYIPCCALRVGKAQFKPILPLDDSQKAQPFIRQSYRVFDNRLVSEKEIETLLTFCCEQLGSHLSTYGIYVYIKASGSSGGQSGFRKYDSENGSLLRVSSSALDCNLFQGRNLSTYKEASFALFIVSKTECGIPSSSTCCCSEGSLIGKALIGAGYVGQALMTKSPLLNVGLCPIGFVETNPVKDALSLEDGERVVYSFLGGGIDRQQLTSLLSDENVSSDDPIDYLRSVAKEKLPSYMVPAYISILESLPLSANGKVDVDALRMSIRDSDSSCEFIAPSNELESRLADIWKSILGLEEVGVLDDFFLLGGHSLNAVNALSRMNHELGVNVSLRAFFEEPTIKNLSYVVDRERRALSEEQVLGSDSEEDFEDFVI